MVERLLSFPPAGSPVPRREATALVALTNGLADAVLRGQHDAGTAVAVLDASIDRLFTGQ